MQSLSPTALRLDLSGYLTQWFRVTTPSGHTIEDIKNPPYWMHHWEKMNVHDKVRCIAEDGSFDITCTVIDKIRGAVRIRIDHAFVDEAKAELARLTKEEAEKAQENNTFPCVRFTSSRHWHVLGYDGKEVISGIKNKSAADVELRKYLDRTKAA